ncbi:hypothetical protein FGO68_gene322 [Halteria grandinella]|uniref:RBR-type E3 ubiquitin transferase n=1 Tax=Halteria grandinella TaxID=5974 RepID=A0A8J8NU59_HALGN|nr:hypothetical protein FGO68_gene322 [Halteria grandinella]
MTDINSTLNRREAQAAQAHIQQLKLLEQEKEPIKFQVGDCKICLMDIEQQDAFPLTQCGHMYHFECIQQYLQSQIKDRKYPILCPIKECKKEIDHSQDMTSLMTEEEYHLYTRYSLEQCMQTQQDISWCPTADCKFAFIYDKNSDNANQLNCPMCKKHYCLQCRALFHTGRTCKEYKAEVDPKASDEAFEEFAKGSKIKQCPKCTVWVEKSEGCNHMSCRCGMQFCYACGGEYQKCACVNAFYQSSGMRGQAR